MRQHALFSPGKRLWHTLLAALLLMLIAGLFVESHPHFGIDAVPGFNAWFPMLVCAALVVLARVLGRTFGPREDEDGR
ncbi:MAG: hypothetical protein H6944_08950 [Zoogloeaceae bacterium]|nr:hypothetical protein [Zoogloeaceae bacterium]MCZ4304287.1 hypothetical protein [Zoogloeaceae bacterium G21618-S1]